MEDWKHSKHVTGIYAHCYDAHPPRGDCQACFKDEVKAVNAKKLGHMGEHAARTSTGAALSSAGGAKMLHEEFDVTAWANDLFPFE